MIVSNSNLQSLPPIFKLIIYSTYIIAINFIKFNTKKKKQVKPMVIKFNIENKWFSQEVIIMLNQTILRLNILQMSKLTIIDNPKKLYKLK